MPKLIDYPRTSYTGAWELAEIVDDTGGKCAIDTAARKLNRKVSGSFKAIIGSAVKFGLMTSKRELLTTTTLFRRIKHAYDKAEELQFHREAFLTPPLFTQLCRKFRNRELPVQMLDVMLIREFGVEEINAQNVAKSFVDGCRMCGLIDERNIIADIDAISSNRPPRRELGAPTPALQSFEPDAKAAHDSATGIVVKTGSANTSSSNNGSVNALALFGQADDPFAQPNRAVQDKPTNAPDAIASLFGFNEPSEQEITLESEGVTQPAQEESNTGRTSSDTTISAPTPLHNPTLIEAPRPSMSVYSGSGYQMQMSGHGVNTSLDIADEDDIAIAIALLEKIRRRLRANN